MYVIALILNILAIPAIFFAGVIAMMSPMLFDAPGARDNFFLWVILCCVWILPVLLLITDIFGWVMFATGDYSGAVFAYKWVLLLLGIVVGSFLLSGWR
ncbi:MAG: hypothetical protein ACKVTZ_20175 [Bacteroidia bacterium]